MYSPRLLQLFRGAAHAGSLPEATHQAEAGTPGQGPYLRLWLRVVDGRVETARFKTYGCPAAIACGEASCEWAEGRELSEFESLTASMVTDWVGGVPEGKEHCPELAATALRRMRAIHQ